MVYILCSASGAENEYKLRHDGERDYSIVRDSNPSLALVHYVADSLDEAVQMAESDGFEFDRLPWSR